MSFMEPGSAARADRRGPSTAGRPPLSLRVGCAGDSRMDGDGLRSRVCEGVAPTNRHVAVTGGRQIREGAHRKAGNQLQPTVSAHLASDRLFARRTERVRRGIRPGATNSTVVPKRVMNCVGCATPRSDDQLSGVSVPRHACPSSSTRSRPDVLLRQAWMIPAESVIAAWAIPPTSVNPTAKAASDQRPRRRYFVTGTSLITEPPAPSGPRVALRAHAALTRRSRAEWSARLAGESGREWTTG